jgi:hypothetical protein
MKHELMHRPLRFARTPAYDPQHCQPRNFVVRSVAEYILDEPLGPEPVHQATVHVARRSAHFLGDRDQRFCANPLVEEPDPSLVGAVRRFGLLGLAVGAFSTAVLRWAKSLIH